MSRTLPGIPTRYNGRVYRSRLEARYAAFFERLAWPYEYEPTDLHGYIPDFIITGIEPMLIEVKPFVPPFENEDVVTTCSRIADGGWLGDALVVGAAHRIDNEPDHEPVLSLVDSDGELRLAPNPKHLRSRRCVGRMRDGDDVWRDAFIGRDGTIWHVTHDDDTSWLSSEDFMHLGIAWAEAGNITQWARPRVITSPTGVKVKP